jgi:hypothetical protein
MSHLQANLRISELLSNVLFGVPKYLLLTVLFVLKVAGPWIVVDCLCPGVAFTSSWAEQLPTTEFVILAGCL